MMRTWRMDPESACMSGLQFSGEGLPPGDSRPYLETLPGIMPGVGSVSPASGGRSAGTPLASRSAQDSPASRRGVSERRGLAPQLHSSMGSPKSGVGFGGHAEVDPSRHTRAERQSAGISSCSRHCRDIPRPVLPDSSSARALRPSRILAHHGDCFTGCLSGPVTATLAWHEPVCFSSVDIHVTCPSRFSGSRAEVVRTWMEWTDASSGSEKVPCVTSASPVTVSGASASPAWSRMPVPFFTSHGRGICSS